MSALDWVFVVFILIIAIVGLFKGFIKHIFGKLSIVLGIWGAFLFYKYLTPYVQKMISNTFLADAIAFVLIFLVKFVFCNFLVIYLVIMIIGSILGKTFDGEIFNGLDRFLGFLIGAVEGLAFVALFLFLISSQPWFDITSITNSSVFYKILHPIFTITGVANV